MTRAPCDQLWLVEAARDGRLDATSAAALRQHVEACSICRAEQAALGALADELRNVAADVDEVSLRRLRRLTLEQASQAIYAQGARPRGWRSLAGSLLAASIAALALLFLLYPEAPSRLPSIGPTAVEVEPTRDAKWRRKLERGVERIELTSGTLLFRVRRLPTDARLIVAVPDGEIEDLGTTFRVTVQDGKTSEIEVREGRVAFHRRGATALHLIAGSTWTAHAQAAPTLTTEPESRPAAPDATPATSPALPSLVPATKPRSTAAPPTSMPDSGEARRSEPRRSHAPAADGDSVPATSAAAAGAREDAAYLHVLALLREGRRDEARLAAFAYLREFPGGFRRVEVRRVVEPLEP